MFKKQIFLLKKLEKFVKNKKKKLRIIDRRDTG